MGTCCRDSSGCEWERRDDVILLSWFVSAREVEALPVAGMLCPVAELADSIGVVSKPETGPPLKHAVKDADGEILEPGV